MRVRSFRSPDPLICSYCWQTIPPKTLCWRDEDCTSEGTFYCWNSCLEKAQQARQDPTVPSRSDHTKKLQHQSEERRKRLELGQSLAAPTPEPYDFYRDYGRQIGELVASKQTQYGAAVGKTGQILAVLYPEGVKTHQYTDVLLTVRVLDKLSRIAQRGADGKDLGGESPFADIAGYGLLGWRKDDEGKTG